MKAIYKREVSSYFNSMIGWIFVAVLTVFIGIYFFAYNLFQGYPYFSLSLGSSLFIFMVVVPILTMRSMADERHTKTDQLLLTAPVSVTAVVLGKYFAMLTVFAVPVAIACLCPLIIALNGTAFLLADYGAILAFFLLGAVEIAVGMLISSLTESQIIAAVGTFGLLLLLYLWGRPDGLSALHRRRVSAGFFVVLTWCASSSRPVQQLEGHSRRAGGRRRGADRLLPAGLLRLRQPAAGCAGQVLPALRLRQLFHGPRLRRARDPAVPVHQRAAGLSDRPGHPEAPVELRGGV